MIKKIILGTLFVLGFLVEVKAKEIKCELYLLEADKIIKTVDDISSYKGRTSRSNKAIMLMMRYEICIERKKNSLNTSK